MGKFDKEAPSLWDDPPPAALEQATVAATFKDGFVEVPHHVWLSWPRRMQLEYCAARDRASAVEVETDEEFEFFVKRAESYDAMAKECDE